MANIGGNMAVRLRQITDEEWQRIDAERARAAQQRAAVEQAKREAEAKPAQAKPDVDTKASWSESFECLANELSNSCTFLESAYPFPFSREAADKAVMCGTAPMSEPQCNVTEATHAADIPQCTGNPAECRACENVSGCAALEGDCPKECVGCECDYEAGYDDGYLDGLADAKPVNLATYTQVNLSLPDMPFVAVPVETYNAVGKRLKYLEGIYAHLNRHSPG